MNGRRPGDGDVDGDGDGDGGEEREQGVDVEEQAEHMSRGRKMGESLGKQSVKTFYMSCASPWKRASHPGMHKLGPHDWEKKGKRDMQFFQMPMSWNTEKLGTRGL